MIYKTSFRDINNTLWEVYLHTNYLSKENSTIVELPSMGGSPVTIKVESGELYKPYKCSVATFQYYISNPYDILNNIGHNNTFIRLYKIQGEDKLLHWQGYVTDQSFNQNFSYINDYFEIEAQDPLSILKYKKYTRKQANDNSIISFEKLLFEMIGKLGVYDNIYVTTALSLPSNDNKKLLEKLHISEDNFFDEDGESISELEVVEEVCKYLSLTCIPCGDSLYFVNYEALKGGYNRYTHYQYQPTSTQNTLFQYPNTGGNYIDKGEVILFNHINLNDISLFAGDDTQVTIDNSYQKITLKSDLYPYDNLLPDLNDIDNYTIIQTKDTLGRYGTTYSNGGRNNIEEVGNGNRLDLESKQVINDGNNESIIVFDIKNSPSPYKLFLRILKYGEIKEATESFRGISRDDIQEVDKFNITTYAYEKNTLNNKTIRQVTITDKMLSYKSLYDYVCVMPVQFSRYDISENLPSYVSFNGISWLFSLSERYYINTSNQPMLKFNIKDVKMQKNNYLLINFDMENFTNKDFLPHIIGNYSELCKDGMGYWLISIKVGNKYYDIENKRYNDYLTKTKLPLQIKKNEPINNRKIGVKSNITYRSKLGNSRGYAIPLTDSKYIDIQDVEITFYRPHFMGNNGDNATNLVVMSDLELKILTQTNEKMYIPTKIEENIEHTNYIDTASYEKMKDINLLLSTNVNQGYNKSTVYFKDEGNLYNIEHVYNRGNGELLTPEQHIINNHIKQYDTPTTTLSTTIFNNDLKPYTTANYHYFNNIFIVDEVSQDIKHTTTTLSLIEKK